jgi:hypothetical protein
MARLPILHKRRRSRRERVVDAARGTARAVISTQLVSAASRVARGRRPKAKLLVVPAAVGGGVLAWRKLAGHREQPADAGRQSPLGPVAMPSGPAPLTS